MKRIFGVALLSLGLILAGAASADAAVLKGNPKSKVYHVETCQFYKGKGTTEQFDTEAQAKASNNIINQEECIHNTELRIQ